jgi:hypothetical protein
MRFHVLGMVVLAASLAGCAVEESDGGPESQELGIVDSEIVVGVGNQGCGRLYRKSATSQNVYLYGCGGQLWGVYYRVPFNGFSTYYCFTGAFSQFVGHQGDIAGGAIRMGQLVEPNYCRDAFPSNRSGGG